MTGTILKGEYKNIKFKYSSNNEEETHGILIINLPNGVESTHIIKNWGVTRIIQYIESMTNLI